MRSHRRMGTSVVVAAVIGLGLAVPPTGAAAAAGQRVDLRVLVVNDGGNASAVLQHLRSEGVPTTEVRLGVTGRPVITAAFLSDVVNGVPRAKFQAVVLPDETGGNQPWQPAGGGLSTAERNAVVTFEQTFGIRQLNAFAYPSPAVGTGWPLNGGQTLDGTVAAATATATAGAFRYLRGPVPFDDVDPQVPEAYGAVGSDLTLPAGESYSTLVQATLRDGTTGPLAGVYSHDGREELSLHFAYNFYSTPFRLLSHGLVTWLTRGVNLGYQRNYFSMHVDDIFYGNSRWSTVHKCTPTNDCPALDTQGVPITTPDIRMTAADEAYLKQWQVSNSFGFDMLFNGEGSDEAVAKYGSDPLTAAFVRDRRSFRWLNHTYAHDFVGCIQDFTVIPWRCVTDPLTGQILYTSQADIVAQITKNLAWAATKDLALNPSELVTGEHSGTRILPQQPADNPNLAPAFTQTGIKSNGLDASREPTQRLIGSSLTVPRHPVNVFYNVATVAEEIDEYNWIYTAAADGGSGYCTANSDTSACIKPLVPADYLTTVVPQQASIVLRHVLTNDPRPHYAHQSNLAEDRILYPVVEDVLRRYRGWFAASAPLVQPTLSQAAIALANSATWTGTAVGTPRGVTAYTLSGKLYLENGGGTVLVPVTVPLGTTLGGAAFGTAYAGELSAYRRVAKSTPAVLTLGPATA